MVFLSTHCRESLSFESLIAFNTSYYTPLELYVKHKDSKKLKKFSPIIYKTDLTKIFLWFIKKCMARTKIDITKRIISMKKKGVAHAEIARSLGCSRSTVINTLKDFAAVFTELPNVKTYQEHKADLLNAAELKVLKSLMQGDKLDKATLNQSAYALQVLHNAGRLERGQATSIQASYSKVITEDVTNSKVIDVTPDDKA